MEKKEYYKHNLPHFQQPGQAYFVTWSLKDAVPKKALKRYTQQLEILKLQMVVADFGAADSDPLSSNRRSESVTPELQKLQIKYYSLRKKYIKAYDDLLDAERNPKIDLSKPENLGVMLNTLKFWESKKLKNHAFCIMPNHVHWVFELLEKDEEGEIVYYGKKKVLIQPFAMKNICIMRLNTH